MSQLLPQTMPKWMDTLAWHAKVLDWRRLTELLRDKVDEGAHFGRQITAAEVIQV
jgi:hypothetical protein